MTYKVLIGLQWGDEGKGKVIDYLSENTDMVVRFQGGNNAGHTIVHGDKTYKLSVLPSGILRSGILTAIGPGVNLDPAALKKEISMLKESGIEINRQNLIIDESTPLILSVHREMDQIIEQTLSNQSIGTTNRGIGPCYEYKTGRRAIRVCDLTDEESIDNMLERIISYHNIMLSGLGRSLICKDDLKMELKDAREIVTDYVGSLWRKINYEYRDKNILFEGAQGAMLDLTYGTYPYVTSSHTVAGNVYVGSGLRANAPIEVIGVSKAYTTRVGNGYFPTEDDGDDGHKLMTIGKEFGSVTGRKRRCGWFDLVATKKIICICGVEEIILTKIDVLDHFEKIKLCVKYNIDGKEIDHIPCANSLYNKITPVYEIIEGWNTDTSKIKSYDQMPNQVKKYVQILEDRLECKISVISNGPDRTSTIKI